MSMKAFVFRTAVRNIQQQQQQQQQMRCCCCCLVDRMFSTTTTRTTTTVLKVPTFHPPRMTFSATTTRTRFFHKAIPSKRQHQQSRRERTFPDETTTESSSSSSWKRKKKPIQITTKDRLRSVRPSVKTKTSNHHHMSTAKPTMDESLISTPQELADRAIQRLQLARSTLQHIWTAAWTGNTNTNTNTNTNKNGQTTTTTTTTTVIMDANWWFWNLLLAASPAIFIAIYCQFIVIPQMIQERKRQLQLQKEESSSSSSPVLLDPTLDALKQASNLSWTESFRGLMEYLQLLEKKIEEQDEQQKRKLEATAIDRKMLPSHQHQHDDNSDSEKSLWQQQLEQLRQQLEELETKMKQQQPTESISRQENIEPPSSNIRKRFLHYQQEQRRQKEQQEQQQQQEVQGIDHDHVKESSPPTPGWLQRTINVVSNWWSDDSVMTPSLPGDVQAESSLPTTHPEGGTSTTTRDNINFAATTTTAATTASVPPLAPKPTVVNDSNNSSSTTKSSILSPSQQEQQQQPCHISRSITHPRDQESEHPLWTLWHKPTD
jgi:hypothetical protein